MDKSRDDLSRLTVPQLKEMCKTKEITFKSNHKKDDLIQLILDTDTSKPIFVTTKPMFVTTTDARKDPPQKRLGGVAVAVAAGDDHAADRTPTTQKSKERIAKFDRTGNVWFETSFLEAALNERLDIQSKEGGKANPSPTLYILVGPASVGKSSAKRLIPEMNDYVINVDVDEIKLYGNDVLPQHPNPKNPDEMKSDVEGIQFKYDLVLEKLRPMVFQNATMPGEGYYKNIILDTTGSMSDQIKMYIRTAKRTFNYTVKVIIVYSDKIQCLQRVKERNRVLFQKGQGARYIPPYVVSSIYDTFLKNNRALFYAIGPRMPELTDELILVDNRFDPRIVARRQPSSGVTMFPDGEHTLVGVDGAFYGLTLNPAQADQPASIVEGNIKTQIDKARSEWAEFDEAEERAAKERAVARAAAGAAAGAEADMGGSRKRRISRRRIRGTRIRKTVKKYYHPHTRRHRHRRHSHRR
jgi:predicted ABC-type ATPase